MENENNDLLVFIFNCFILCWWVKLFVFIVCGLLILLFIFTGLVSLLEMLIFFFLIIFVGYVICKLLVSIIRDFIVIVNVLLFGVVDLNKL